MRINFFEATCQEPPLNNELFGLCDDQDGTKAYTDVGNHTNWIATVKNDNKIELTFTAIDKCVIKDNEEPDRGRCDGMITSANHIYFIELKDQAKGWIADAVNQIESTVQFFKENHDISIYRHKKAFVCNKKHRHFQEMDNEFNLRFFRKHKVRIDLQGEIIIV